MSTTPEVNDQLVLIAGESGTGKSASLKEIRNQDRWLYMNSEAGKRLPFKNNFMSRRIADPYEVHGYLDEAAANIEHLDGAILDSITFLMDMLETMYIRNAANTQKAWGDFSDYFKVLMQQKVVLFNKPIIITAHTRSDLDEKAMEMKTAVPVKGSLKNNGVEAYFSTVVAAKKMSLKDLEPYRGSSLLKITEEEEELGFKHVFQTRITKTTTGERIRSPMGLFTKEQTFMDNNAQLLLDHLHDFYN